MALDHSDGQPVANGRYPRHISRMMLITAMVLSFSSIALLFWSTFPWQHHNESLVWDVGLAKATFWQSLTSNPVQTVANHRPLGLALAWVTFHLTSDHIWLQQVVNFVITAAAWAIACSASRKPVVFAWISFLAGAVFFSGYIYLFHLHGVFYPPLFVFLSILLVHQSRAPALGWKGVVVLFVLAVITSLFHPFALLIFVAYMVGICIEYLLERRPVRLGAVLLGIGAAMVVAALLLKGHTSGVAEDTKPIPPLVGLVTSYRTLEVNSTVMAVSFFLTVLAGLTIGITRRQRIIGGIAFGAAAVALALAGIPVVIGWIIACLITSLRNRRIALAALISACAVLPLPTGTGSPTYAIFVLMPCVLATADGLPELPIREPLLRWLSVAGVATSIIILILLRSGISIPGVGGPVRLLRSEQEKTVQLAQALEWLKVHREVTGRLQYCEPGGSPSQTTNALDRTYRAPTETPPLETYVVARFGSRLTAGPPIYLCFGGQQKPDTTPLYSIPGRWAGTATIRKVVAPS